ncbi:MAG TPA: EexN family lipoprotein [Nitrospira sp.]|nr:EexN family lipoprotein [Nitrospira sp.]
MKTIGSMRSVQSGLFVGFLLGAFVMELSLTSCTREAWDPDQDVQWYKTHETERKSMLAKCHNNPGQLTLTPNCVNAEQAWKEVMATSTRSSFDTLKPMTAEEFNK